ncbi:MAG: His-Xaa-Ser system radical SAM maturase HxsC [Oscillospiraceae bacterium]
MNMRFKAYNLGYRIVSLALDECQRDKLIKEELPLIYVNSSEGTIVLLPDEIVLSRETDDLEHIKEFNNYDVFELWENGALIRKYNDKSGDNYFFVSGKCNSNCIMCPSPEFSRKNSSSANLADLLNLAEHIPSDVSHLTITGGEPFLMGEQIFPFLRFLKEKFLATEFLFLTNGRIFAIDKYIQMFCETAPSNSVVAVPLHGSCEQIHDAITRTEGSFKQTMLGIKRLLKNGIPVEIRLVVSKLNVGDFDNIAQLIIKQLKGIDYVSVIAMEMTGTARANQEQVWISYKKSFAYIANAVRTLLQNGVDVKLYNFPICTVERPFWTLCEKSISDNKVRFTEDCEFCKLKNACSGVFAGTLQLEKEELRPIL